MTCDVRKALKTGREMSGLRKNEVAEKINVDERTLSRYESVNPNTAVKNADDGIIAEVMKLYGGRPALLIGLVYFMNNPVGKALTDLILNGEPA